MKGHIEGIFLPYVKLSKALIIMSREGIGYCYKLLMLQIGSLCLKFFILEIIVYLQRCVFQRQETDKPPGISCRSNMVDCIYLQAKVSIPWITHSIARTGPRNGCNYHKDRGFMHSDPGVARGSPSSMTSCSVGGVACNVVIVHQRQKTCDSPNLQFS